MGKRLNCISSCVGLLRAKTFRCKSHGARYGLDNAPVLSWRRSHRRRHRLTIKCVWLHQLDASAIRIKQIRLTLPVDAHFDLNRQSIALRRCSGFEGRNSFFYIGCKQANVGLDAPLPRIGWLRVEHEFEIVLPVRNSHIGPAQRFARRAASPELLNTENAAIKFRRWVERADSHALVGHVCRNPCIWQALSLCAPRPAIRLVLDDLDCMTVRVSNVEV